MRKLLIPLLLFLALARVGAEDLQGPGNLPIEITSTGQTTYENGLATARDNVAIHFGDTDIYADLRSTIRLSAPSSCRAMCAFIAASPFTPATAATYGLDTKAVTAEHMRTGTYPI